MKKSIKYSEITPRFVKIYSYVTGRQLIFIYFLYRETNHLKTKELSAQIGSSRLSFAKPEFMEQYLDITPGSVSVMGLMNDIEHKVQLLIDEDILKKEYFGCHPCVNTSSLKFKTTDLMERIIPELEHTPKW